MRLGNSGGRNKGKKYLKRNSLDYDKLSADDYARLDDFNTWYVDNIKKIESELKAKNSFNEDILNDTYAKMCESILFANLEMKDYKSYFCRAYFTNNIQVAMTETRYVHTEEQALVNHINATQDDWDNDKEKQTLIKDIFRFVKKNYSQRDSSLLIQYMNLDNCTYQDLTQLTGIKTNTIQRIISRIKGDIQSNMHFVARRNQIK